MPVRLGGGRLIAKRDLSLAHRCDSRWVGVERAEGRYCIMAEKIIIYGTDT